jgi:hypothetical protein
MEARYENLVLKAHRRALHLGPVANPEDRRVYFFHLKGLKSDDKIAFRAALGHWWRYTQAAGDKSKSYEDWLADYWGTPDRDQQIAKCLERFFGGDQLQRYQKIGGGWGDYPTLLKPYFENPKYEIVYENGKPHHRVTHPDREIPLPGKI